MVGEAKSNDGITDVEKKLIFQLKVNVKEKLPQSIISSSEEDKMLYFVRWIRARENHVEKATDMLRNHLKWRNERDADQVLSRRPHPFFYEHYPVLYPGTDRMGRPVVCVPLSDWDFRHVINDSERLAEFDDFTAHTFETFTKKIEQEHAKRGPGQPPITQITFLMDAKNYPYGQLIKYSAIKKILQLAGVYEAHYPEILHKAVFIHCPSYFGMFLNLVKPVVAAKTMSKLSCFSSESKWQENIGDLVDPAIIPERYGGTLKK